MSRLRELVEQLCPDGVEYKQLQNVVSLRRGVRVVKRDLQPTGEYPVYQNSLTPLGFYDKSNFSGGTTFVICAGAAGGIGYCDVDFWAADDCFCVEQNDSVDSKYVFYVLQTQQIKIDANVRKASIPRLPRWALDELVIPVPPIEVQREVVRILDSFQELDDALTAEIEARENQYRNVINLSSVFQLDRIEFGKVASFSYGLTATAASEGDYRIIRITDITNDGLLSDNDVKYVSSDLVAKKDVLSAGDVVIARTGASFGKTLFYEGTDKAVFASFLIKPVFDISVLLPKFYWHFTHSNDYWIQANRLVSGGAQPQFNANALKQLLVPTPSISEQEEISGRLDSLRRLIDLLKNERDARRRQLAYYRDKLLAFPEKG